MDNGKRMKVPHCDELPHPYLFMKAFLCLDYFLDILSYFTRLLDQEARLTSSVLTENQGDTYNGYRLSSFLPFTGELICDLAHSLAFSCGFSLPLDVHGLIKPL
jgi:hypothetical protein